MIPHSFVQDCLKSGNHYKLIEVLNDYYSTMSEPYEMQSFEMRAFPKAFIIGLMQELEKLSAKKDVEEQNLSAYLMVWQNCGYIGLEKIRHLP
jgi:hypothetical protein